jgi:tRNA-dihydrouridine synthase C
MLTPNTPALILAPMEGVTDAPMRALQGETGAFTFAVSEFLRVHHSIPSRTTILRHVPELRHGGYTPSGMPVQVQILGGDAGRMAEAAAAAHAAGATAIDINFGCPARTVNHHDGGATLLRHPKRIREIVAAIRKALPTHVPVSAKLRLGWDSIDAIFENAEMAAEGGASWLTIHARTRVAGYAPPVYWRQIGRVRERLHLPIVANGDIWTIADFRQCRDETGCRHFMLGRGALANPHLALEIAMELGIASDDRDMPVQAEVDWHSHLRRLVEWTRRYDDHSESAVFRLKQWLHLAARFGKFTHFDAIKRATRIEELFLGLDPWT